MIKVYYLPVETVDGVEQVAGVTVIHHGILQCTADPGVMKLIMEVTTAESSQLIAVALAYREPTQDEVDLYSSIEFSPPAVGFHPEDPVLGVEQRLAHVEDFLHQTYPSSN